MNVVMVVPAGLPFGLDWARAVRPHASVVTVAHGRPPPGEHARRLVQQADYQLPSARWRLLARPGFRPLRHRLDARQLRRLVERLAREGGVDILHGHFYAHSWALPALGAALGVPYVVTEHSSRLTGRSARHKPLTPAGRRMAEEVLRGAALVLPVSQYLADAMIKLDVCDPAQTHVIGNPVDVATFRLRARRPSDPVIVSVGRLESDKNPVMLVEAMSTVVRDVPGAVLELVGDGPARREVEAVVAARGLSDSVRFLGTLPRAEVAARLRGAAVVAMASSVETFCLAAAEALATGVPAVLPAIGAFPELASGTATTLVEPGDVPALAAALVAELRHPRSDDELRRSAAEVERRYSPSAVGWAVAAVYAALVPAPTSMREEPPRSDQPCRR